MTVLADRRLGDPAPPVPVPPGQTMPPTAHDADEPEGVRSFVPLTPRRITAVAVAWLAVTVVGVGLVVYGLGPMLEQRDQRNLLADYRAQIETAANEAFGLPGIEKVTVAPDPGDPVAIVEIPAIRFRQVVVEGVGPQQTRHGPGHVPGTAGPGQPGNSAVVGRQAAFGGPFSEIDQLETGDEIVVTTVQGQSLYAVTEKHHGPVSRVEDYGPSKEDDRLTMITSGSASPLAQDPADVVVAEMETRPFEPTPQGGRIASQDGRRGDGSALAVVMLATLGYFAAAGAAVLLYRRTRPRSAYLMTAPLLVVATVLIAEAAARLLPAWF